MSKARDVGLANRGHLSAPPGRNRADFARSAAGGSGRWLGRREAERERCAKVIAAEAEDQAAERLPQAANVITPEHGALTLRTLAEMATEHNSTLVFPIPMDVLDAAIEHVRNDRPGVFVACGDG